jgi:hypothetical protein
MSLLSHLKSGEVEKNEKGTACFWTIPRVLISLEGLKMGELEKDWYDELESGKISYEMLVKLLNRGREIVFIYDSKKFSITNTPNGFSLCEYYSEEPQTFPDVDELLVKARIDGHTLSEIWDDVLVDQIF